MLAIFKKYPQLKNKISYIPLGNFPTPVYKLKNLSRCCEREIYIKRDDLSGTIYGGNKVRKLEFLLADALRKKKKEIITLGGVCSNHMVATSIYASKLNLKTYLVLFPQLNTSYLKNNLLLVMQYNATIIYSPHIILVPFYVLKIMIFNYLKQKTLPYLIPPGGTNWLGALGYLNAVLELKEQIENKEIPEPDFIFVTGGSCGTLAGIIAGVKLTKLKSKVIGVQVVEKIITNKFRIKNIANNLIKTLCKIDKAIPEIKITSKDFKLLKKYFGGKYAKVTRKSKITTYLFKTLENLNLECTYTGKTFSAALDFCLNKKSKNKNILLWHTYNSKKMKIKNKSKLNYLHHLPKKIQPYFYLDLQPEDKINVEKLFNLSTENILQNNFNLLKSKLEENFMNATKKLKVGDISPNFTGENYKNQKFKLSDFKGKDIILIFLRYWGCPICKLHLNEIKNNYAQFKEKNIEVLVIMETSKEELKNYKVDELFPFEILSDPQKEIFKLYKVERGTISPSLFAKEVLKKFFKATLKGIFHGKYNGDDLQLPADFVIDQNGKIIYTYYGKNIADNTPPKKILNLKNKENLWDI